MQDLYELTQCSRRNILMPGSVLQVFVSVVTFQVQYVLPLQDLSVWQHCISFVYWEEVEPI